MNFNSFAILFFCLFIASTTASFSEVITDPLNASLQKQVNFRHELLSCSVFFTPYDPVLKKADDGIGFKISSNNKNDFELAVKEIIKEQGVDVFNQGGIYITGVPMGKKKSVKNEFQEILLNAGVSSSVKVKALTVPAHLVDEQARNFTKNMWHDFLYFFPSMERNYQKPLKGEVSAGFQSMLPVEIPSSGVIYSSAIANGMPLTNLNITTLNHAAILAVYNIYQKATVNWLMAPGETYAEKEIKRASIELAEWLSREVQKRENHQKPRKFHEMLVKKIPIWGEKFTFKDTSLFLKQMSLSFPFVVNYNVFGRFTEVRDFLVYEGLPSWSQMMGELGDFVATHGLTTGLQTYFYKKVSTQKVMGWLQQVNGKEDQVLARTFVNYIRIPVLVLDAAVLFFASNGTLPLSDIIPFAGDFLNINLGFGTFEPNVFQLGLIGLTAWGNKWYSNAYLDRTFNTYKASQRLKNSRKQNSNFLKDRSQGFSQKAIKAWQRLTGLGLKKAN